MQFVCICRIIGWHATLIFKYTMTTQCDAILKIDGTDQSHLGSHSKEAFSPCSVRTRRCLAVVWPQYRGVTCSNPTQNRGITVCSKQRTRVCFDSQRLQGEYEEREKSWGCTKARDRANHLTHISALSHPLSGVCCVKSASQPVRFMRFCRHVVLSLLSLTYLPERPQNRESQNSRPTLSASRDLVQLFEIAQVVKHYGFRVR
jgi:hypothetical protein